MIMKTLFIVLLILGTGQALAQEGRPMNQQVWCFEQRAVMEVLARDYKETPIFHGQNEASNYVLYSNEKTGGWTLIAYQDGLGCIMAAGKKHTQIFGKGI